MNSKPTQHYIPTINGTATTNEEKANQFREVLLPALSSLPLADTSDITATHTYPEPMPFNPTITKQQLERAIGKLAPDKAPGPDEITNRILKKNFGSLQTHLLALARACLDTGYFPSTFKKTLTIVLRKPNKPDYTKPNAYRPIALECTIGKILESIITELLSYLIETHDLLPANHFGARPQRTTEDAMMVLSENIYRAWKQRRNIHGRLHGCSWSIQQCPPQSANPQHEKETHPFADSQASAEFPDRTNNTAAIQWSNIQRHKYRSRNSTRIAIIPNPIHVVQC